MSIGKVQNTLQPRRHAPRLKGRRQPRSLEYSSTEANGCDTCSAKGIDHAPVSPLMYAALTHQRVSATTRRGCVGDLCVGRSADS